MKSYEYEWKENRYLLHAQIDKKDVLNEKIEITRFYKNTTEKEYRKILEKSFRFIVYRKSPQEKMIKFTYPDNMVLKVFELEDRAFYPVTPCFEG